MEQGPDGVLPAVGDEERRGRLHLGFRPMFSRVWAFQPPGTQLEKANLDNSTRNYVQGLFM